MTREELFSYVKEEYAQEPDYPWENDFESAVLRHSDTGKWFALSVFEEYEDEIEIFANNVTLAGLKYMPY